MSSISSVTAEKPNRKNGGSKQQERGNQTVMAEKPNRNNGENELPVNIMKPLTITHIIR